MNNLAPIALAGSVNRGEGKTPENAQRIAYSLGKQLGHLKWPLMVYSDDPRFCEAQVLKGYLDSGSAEERSIIVLYPEKDPQGNPKTPPFNSFFNDPRFLFQPDPNPDWQVSYYSSFERSSAVLLIQGGPATLVAGVISLGYRKPIVACAGFGGSAAKILSLLADRGLVLPAEKALLQRVPPENEMDTWAGQCLKLLDAQQTRLAERHAREALTQKSLQQRTVRYALVAFFSIVLAVTLTILGRNQQDEGLLLTMIFAASALAGCTGAMIWTILPLFQNKPPSESRSLLATVLLGLVAGIVSALFLVAARDSAFPDLKSYLGPAPETVLTKIRAEFLAKLIPSSVISSLVAGLTLDRALAGFAKRGAESSE